MTLNIIRKFFDYSLTKLELDKLKLADLDSTSESKLKLYSFAKNVSEELFTPGYQELLDRKKKDIDDILLEAELKEKKKSRYIVAIFLGILLLALSFAYHKNSTRDSSKLLFAELNEIAESAINIDPIGTVNRGSNTEKNLNIWYAVQEQDNDYIVSHISDEEDNKTLKFIKARALLKLNRNHECLQICNQLYTSDFNQKDALLWTLAQVHLSMGHVSQSKDFLNEIIKYKYSNYKKAKLILTKL